jgi:hypothetical protein
VGVANFHLGKIQGWISEAHPPQALTADALRLVTIQEQVVRRFATTKGAKHAKGPVTCASARRFSRFSRVS